MTYDGYKVSTTAPAYMYAITAPGDIQITRGGDKVTKKYTVINLELHLTTPTNGKKALESCGIEKSEDE